MKRNFIRNIILIIFSTIILSNIHSISAYAKWQTEHNDNWSWIENGTKHTGWKLIDGKWYYFDDYGTMGKGWINYNQKWYNLSKSGQMNIGWIKDYDGKWYNLSENGEMNTGWISENGKWYYMNSSGAMETKNVEIDGKVYIFLENGVLSNSTVASLSQEVNQEQGILKEKNNLEENVKETIKSRKAYVATETSPLNIRSEASTSSTIIGTLSKGTEVIIDNEETDGFFYVSANGLKGWASEKWISFEKPINSNQSNIKDLGKNKKNLNEDIDSKIDSSLSEIRNVAPKEDNKYYYSDSNIFFKAKLSPPYSKGGNCTWYSWGRAWEITGKPPTDAGFNGNAYEWWDANKKSGKYKYGSTPKVGSIAVWKSSLPGSGGCGHVAIVEKIKNGDIYISESMWHGGVFEYLKIYSTQFLYGYIYINEPNY